MTETSRMHDTSRPTGDPKGTGPARRRNLLVRGGVLLTLCAAPLFWAGCSGCSNATVSDDDAPPPDTTQGDIDSSWVKGPWKVMLSVSPPEQQGKFYEMAGFVVEFVTQDDGELAAQLVQTNTRLMGGKTWKLGDVRIGQKTLTLTFVDVTNPQRPREIMFEGQRSGDVILGGVGNLQLEPLMFAKLAPPKDETERLEDANPARGQSKFADVLSAADPIVAYEGFIKKYPHSTLTLRLGRGLIRQVAQTTRNESQIAALANLVIEHAGKHGPTFQLGQEIQLASILVQRDVALDKVDDIITRLENIDPKGRPMWIDLERLRERLALGRQLNAYVAAKSADAKEEVLNALVKMESERDRDPEVSYHVARIALDLDRDEMAISRLLELNAMPGANRNLNEQFSIVGAEYPSPKVLLQKTWEEQHGSIDGLDAKLEEVYNEVVYDFLPAGEPDIDIADNQRTVLLELFTGGACPPCVAADLAVGAFREKYPSEQVIVLQYHQHSPAPDPLANPASEHRYHSFYELQGTPRLVLNGLPSPLPAPGIGGAFEDAAPRYNSLRPIVETMLQELRTEVKIDLKAKREGDVISWSASVNELPERGREPRLMLAIAERSVDGLAMNGLRRHDMVVRDMIRSSRDGYELTADNMKISGTYDLAELRERNKKYITEFALQNELKLPEFPREFKQMYLVAIVQDGEASESRPAIVHQAALVPLFEEKPQPVTPKAEPKNADTDENKTTDEKTTREPLTAPRPEVAKPVEEMGSLLDADPWTWDALQPVMFQEETSGDENKTGTKDDPQAKNEAKGKTEPAPEKPEAVKPVVRRRLLILNQTGRRIPIAFFQFVTRGEETSASILARINGGLPIDLNRIFVSNRRLVLDFVTPRGTQVRFEGLPPLDPEDTIFGSTTVGPNQMFPTELINIGDATFDDVLGSFDQFASGYDAFLDAESVEEFLAFSKDNPHSPLHFSLLGQMLTSVPRETVTNEAITAIADRTAKLSRTYGERFSTTTLFDIVEVLAQNRIGEPVAKRYLDRFQDRLNDRDYQSWKPLIDRVNERFEIAELKRNAMSDELEVRRPALDALTDRLGDADPEVTYLVARDLQLRGEKQKAFDTFLPIVIEPNLENALLREWSRLQIGLPTATKVAKELYADMKADDAPSFDDLLLIEYGKYVDRMVQESPQFDRNEKASPVLVELFTGTACPACAGIDLATEVLEKMTSPEDVIFVHHHQHVAGPDPFASPETETLMQARQLPGAPVLFINGQQIGLGGSVAQTEQLRDELVKVIGSQLQQPSPIDIELSANAKDGNIVISAKVVGDADVTTLGPAPVMTLMLIEKRVDYPGQNRIRTHSTISRDFIPSLRGVRPQDGELSYNGTVSLTERREELLTYLRDFEEAASFKFDRIPMDFANLSLVAVVSERLNGRVIAAKEIPVTGVTKLPPVGDASEKTSPPDEKQKSGEQESKRKPQGNGSDS